MNSNRYFGMTPVRVEAAPAYLPNDVICPVCHHITYINEDEVGYHGSNGGAYLCKGSGYIIGEIVTPLVIVAEVSCQT